MCDAVILSVPLGYFFFFMIHLFVFKAFKNGGKYKLFSAVIFPTKAHDLWGSRQPLKSYPLNAMREGKMSLTILWHPLKYSHQRVNKFLKFQLS